MKDEAIDLHPGLSVVNEDGERLALLSCLVVTPNSFEVAFLIGEIGHLGYDMVPNDRMLQPRDVLSISDDRVRVRLNQSQFDSLPKYSLAPPESWTGGGVPAKVNKPADWPQIFPSTHVWEVNSKEHVGEVGRVYLRPGSWLISHLLVHKDSMLLPDEHFRLPVTTIDGVIDDDLYVDLSDQSHPGTK